MATFDIDEYLKSATQGQAAAAVPQAPGAPSTPFYKRPITIPAGVKIGAKSLLKGSGVLGGAMLAADLMTDILPRAAANAIVGEPTLQATVERGRSGYGAKPPAPTPVSEPALPTAAPARAARPITGDTGPAPTTPGVGGFFGAVARLRGIQSRQTAQQAAALKLPGAQKDLMESALLSLRFREAEKARIAGASPGEVAAIAAGRSSGEGYTALPDLSGQFIDVVQTRGPGAGRKATRLKPQPVISEDDITATMTAHKMTREQVIERLKKEGRY